jgi:hypothetical protein
MDFKIVAPSLVTVMFSFRGPAPAGIKILSFFKKQSNVEDMSNNLFNVDTIPFGPRVVLTRSATAIAPMKVV